MDPLESCFICTSPNPPSLSLKQEGGSRRRFYINKVVVFKKLLYGYVPETPGEDRGPETCDGCFNSVVQKVWGLRQELEAVEEDLKAALVSAAGMFSSGGPERRIMAVDPIVKKNSEPDRPPPMPVEPLDLSPKIVAKERKTEPQPQAVYCDTDADDGEEEVDGELSNIEGVVQVQPSHVEQDNENNREEPAVVEAAERTPLKSVVRKPRQPRKTESTMTMRPPQSKPPNFQPPAASTPTAPAQQNFQCSNCEREFSKKRNLVMHEVTNCGVEYSDQELEQFKITLLECPECPFKSGYSVSMNNHLKTHGVFAPKTPSSRNKRRAVSVVGSTRKKKANSRKTIVHFEDD